MKKVKIALLMLLAFVLILPACKKGPNDPFLSLKSRKARLVGEWELKEGTTTTTGIDIWGGNSYSFTQIYTFSGTTRTFTGSYDGTPYTPVTILYTQNVTFDKDETYENVTNDDGDIYTEKGGWYFGGANKEFELKNKETVLMSATSYTSTSGSSSYTGTDAMGYPSVWLLDELSSKELIVSFDGTSSNSGGSSTTTGTLTFEKN
ncbi:MAG: hypothetical protein V1904_11435 [Bacteroidota bacterium]